MNGAGGIARRSLWSASLAPVLLIGGWTLAAAHQPAGFSSTDDTISALAGNAATDRWIMTVALAGLGLCHLVTASGFRAAAPAGRWLLAVGGLATLAVAAFPLPSAGASVPHAVAAGIAFVALSGWPVLSVSRRAGTAWPLRPVAGITASTVLFALLAGFVALAATGSAAGLAERITAGAQAVWPLIAVWAVWAARSSAPS